MLGSTSLIETSLESGSSSLLGSETPVPEDTLATFILHVVGAAIGKLHHLSFLTTTTEGEEGGEGGLEEFLQWEVRELLLLLTYILQSGHCPRLARACIGLARQAGGLAAGALHNVDAVTEQVLQLRHVCPTVAVQWLYILILLERCPLQVWARVLNTQGSRPPGGHHSNNSNAAAVATSSRLAGGETAEPCPVLQLEMVRRAGLAIMANHLVEHTSEGELLAWFLSSQTRELVRHSQEPQIQELISVLHRQAPSSGLLLETVAVRWESLADSSQSLARVLNCVSNTHRAHTGRLLQLLVTRCLVHPTLGLARRAHTEACRRTELLLSEREEFVRDQLAQSDLANMLEILSKNRRLVQRYGRLVGLLNRLAVSFFDLSPVDMGEGRKFSPGSISSVELDKAWFLAQVKRSCCTTGAAPRACAKLLSNLRFSDIMLVLTAKDFKLPILEECLVQGISLPDVRAASLDSLDRLPGLLSDPERSPGLREAAAAAASSGGGGSHQLREGPPLYRAASQVLLQHIKNVIELLPRPPQVYRAQAWWPPSAQESRYNHRLDDFFSRSDSRQLILQLVPAFSRLLLTYPLLPGRRPPSLPPHAVLEMARFGVLALELVKWLVAGCREARMPGTQHMVDACLAVAGLTLSNPHLAGALSLPANNALACSAVLAVTDYLTIGRGDTGLRLPIYPFQLVMDLLQHPDPQPLLVSAACLARLLMHCEAAAVSDHDHHHLDEKIFSIVVGLARLPQFASLARAPPLAFSLGWRPDLSVDQQGVVLGSAVPSALLQEQDVLHQLIWRINVLGWAGRAQFEETWMCLLSVLNVAQDDLTNEEVSALAQSTASVVAALAALLVATLGLPVAGIPGARLLHHPRDMPNSFFLTGRGQQLTAIQNIIHQRLSSDDVSGGRGGTTAGLPVDSSVNLERAFAASSGGSGGYSPVPATRYGLGQVSLGYLHTCLAYHEESSGGGSADQDRVSMASAALPLFFLIREENLAAAGLDTHSCIQFVIDLFSQWLAAGPGASQDTPLGVLTAAVRAITMISDMFTLTGQFAWMQACLADLQRVHPPEDELMAALLCLGLAKAVAVTGRLDADLWDRLRKTLETQLRSQHAFAQTAATHSLLYLLQRDFGSEEAPGLLPLAMEHVKTHLVAGRGLANASLEDSCLVTWSLLFFILEHCGHELTETAELAAAGGHLVQLCLAAVVGTELSRPAYTCLMAGLERLVVAGCVARGRDLDQVVKLATDLMTEWAPVSVLPAIQLFLGRSLAR